MRGRMLADSGRLKDALAVLEQVRPTDAESDRAVELRSEIQKQLLGLDPRSGTVTTRRPGGQSPR
jgi:hypothetical protein